MKQFKRVLAWMIACVILCSCVPISVSADVGDSEWVESESNNYHSSANPVYNDYTVSGRCSYPDVDYYEVVVTSSATITVIVVGDNSHLLMGLENSGGTAIAAAQTSYTTGSNGGYYAASMSKAVSAGTYYVGFLSESGYSNNYTFYITISGGSSGGGGSTHTHSYTSTVVNPTCTADGYTTYVCSCGYSYNGSYRDATGHSWQNATCTAPKTCTTCGATEGEAAGHSFNSGNACSQCSTGEVLQSDHYYTNNTDRSWTCQKSGATQLMVTFSSSTETEQNYDFIYIYDGNNNQIGKYSGTSLASDSISVPGDTVRIRLTSDGSNTEYGFYATVVATNCSHSNQCTTPRVCTRCGYQITTGHTYDSLSDTTCNVCGAVRNVNETGWIQQGGRWYYMENGRPQTNRWKEKDSKWVYVGSDGAIVTNKWIQDSKGWCYVGDDGYCITNQVIKDSKGWVYLDAAGRMTKSTWAQSGNKWYYVGANGYCVTNQWKQDTKGWCYLGADGAMVTNKWLQDSKGWCYIGANGYCITNQWKQDSKGWCYLGADGRMVTNKWLQDSKGWCYIGANGYCVTDQWKQDTKGWVYLDAAGRMATNRWIQDSKGWCYLGSSGYMVKNQWVQGAKGWCYVGSNGYMVTNKWLQDSKGWCYIGANGYCVTNQWKQDTKGWVYLGEDGSMVKNQWVNTGNKWYYLNNSGYMVKNQWVQDSDGWMYLGSDGTIVYNKWVKGSGGWCYIGSDGYMVTNTWEWDSNGWHYIGANGYITRHELDYCNHNFSEPTYTAAAECYHCGAVRGESLDLPITLEGSEPYYTWAYDYKQAKVYNVYYSVSDNRLKIYFDVEAVLSNTSGFRYFAAEFKLFDSQGYLIDDSYWAESGLDVGEKSRGEYVYLDLSSWDGYSPLILSIGDYNG